MTTHNFILADRLRIAWWASLLFFIGFSILGSMRVLPEWTLRFIPIALAPVPGIQALLAVVTGNAPMRFGSIDRRRNPIGFWAAASFYGIFTLFLVAIPFFAWR